MCFILGSNRIDATVLYLHILLLASNLVRQLVHDQGITLAEVRAVLNRGLSSVCRQLEKTRPVKMVRPTALTAKHIDKLVAIVEAMVVQADANYDVTLAMVPLPQVTIQTDPDIGGDYGKARLGQELQDQTSAIVAPQGSHPFGQPTLQACYDASLAQAISQTECTRCIPQG